jgi:L-malate glycosyltransferase
MDCTIMKVMFVSHSYVIEENFKNIRALARHAEIVAVMPDRTADMFQGEQLAEVADDANAKVFRRLSLPRQQFVLLTSDMGMRAFKPDVINVEYDPWCPIFWQTLLYKAYYVPQAKLVCTVKKNTFRKAMFPFQTLKDVVFRALSGSVDRFIAINRGVARIYSGQLGIAAARIVTMQHLGTDTELFRPADQKLFHQNPFVIGYAGRFAEHKGVLDLLDACKRLAEAGRPIRLKLLGAGPLDAQLEAMDYPWLELFPPVRHEDVAGFLQGLDLFVMPARITPDHEEHDGHAVIEALSCGIPCLGSSSGVLPELVAADQGYMFEANNSTDLTDKLGQIIDNPDRHKALALSDRERVVERYSIERLARDRITLFESLNT